MKRIRIGIIDDHQLIIDGIMAMFRNDENIEFIGSANTGFKAREMILELQDQIDLIITDISMPELSGIEICEFVKTEFSDKKVLIMSMYQSSTVISEALRVDADGYILKTAGFEEFRTAIYRVIDGSSYYSEAIYPIIYKEYQKDKEKQQYLDQLTQREVEVLQLIIRELTSTEIADELCISKKTVDNHRQNLLTKTQSKSTIGLVKFALKAGMKLD